VCSRARNARSVCALSLAMALVIVPVACRDELPEPPPFAPDLAVDLSNSDRTDTGLYIEILDEAQGDPAGRSERIGIYYKGWLPDGKIFDSNEGEAALIVDLSRSFLIDGVTEGLKGIHVGERRRLVIPPDLGYGETGDLGYVPRNSWLVYEVRRVDVAVPPR
jgi:FKBP-type peptidyl-prolyl cis-trans isomerase FkpA